MTVPLVSLIVATVNRDVELACLFDSLASQTFQDFEVIIVDQNADDRIEPHIARARKAHLSILHMKHYPANLSAARNAGLGLARGAWIGFPDDDCWYAPSLLERLQPYFVQESALSGVSARWMELVDASVPAGPLSWARSRLFRDVPVTSFTLFFNRGLFGHIGDFDPRLGVGQWFGAGEETDLVLRALQAGAALHYEPSAQVCHPLKEPQPTRQERLAQRVRARGAGALYRKHRLPLHVVVRGLLAPVLRPLLRGAWGHQLALGYAVARGRWDGMRGWGRGRGEPAIVVALPLQVPGHAIEEKRNNRLTG